MSGIRHWEPNGEKQREVSQWKQSIWNGWGRRLWFELWCMALLMKPPVYPHRAQIALHSYTHPITMLARRPPLACGLAHSITLWASIQSQSPETWTFVLAWKTHTEFKTNNWSPLISRTVILASQGDRREIEINERHLLIWIFTLLNLKGKVWEYGSTGRTFPLQLLFCWITSQVTVFEIFLPNIKQVIYMKLMVFYDRLPWRAFTVNCKHCISVLRKSTIGQIHFKQIWSVSSSHCYTFKQLRK